MGKKNGRNGDFVFEEDLHKDKRTKDLFPLFVKADYLTEENSEVALSNPFLYQYNENYNIYSIEDFGLAYKDGLFEKKEYVYLRSVIHNGYIPSKKKWRKTRRYFKSNKRDYKRNLNRLKKEATINESNYNNLKIDKISWKIKLVLFIALAIYCFIFTLFNVFKLNIYTNSWFTKLNETLYLSLKQPYVLAIFILAGLVIILNYVYIFWYKRNCNKSYVMQKRYFKSLKKYFKVSNRKFRKCYRRLYRYYKDMILNKKNNINTNCIALGLDELWNSKIDFTKAKETAKEVEANNNKMLHLQNINRFMKWIVFILTITINITLIVYVVIQCFKIK